MEVEIVRTGIEKKFYELVEKIVKEESLDLYAMDYLNGSQVLRVFIQNPETKTATLEDCARIDRAMTPFVEESDWMPDSLTLEVSSPGVYRDLKELQHFHTAVGERLALSLYEKVGTEDFLSGAEIDKKILKDKKLTAYLLEIDGSDSLQFGSQKAGRPQFKIKLENIKKANVEPLWEDLKDHKEGR